MRPCPHMGGFGGGVTALKTTTDPGYDFEVRSDWPWRVFAQFSSLNVGADGLRLGGRRFDELPLKSVRSVLRRRGLFRSAVVIERVNGARDVVPGISKDDADRAVQAIERKLEATGRAEATIAAQRLDEIAVKASALFAEQRWLRHKETQVLGPLLQEAESLGLASWPWIDGRQRLVAQGLTELRPMLDQRRRDHNDAYVRREAPAASEAIENTLARDKRPTDEQLCAIATAEDCTLVLAGAGTGKTTTIVGKVAHLVARRGVPSKAILVLTFNHKAAEEITLRLKSVQGVVVTTFHALGRSIIADAQNAAPSLAPFAEDETKIRPLITGYVADLMRAPATRKLLINYFVSHMAPYRSAFEFSSPGEYYEYIRRFELRTLTGDLVKSFEELEIANFLAVSGVAFEYEARYSHPTATKQHRQYQPDFYLPDYDIYIEHFGINRDGSTAPGVDRARYHAGMVWKREVHGQNGTKCIETFSYQRREGSLLEGLEEQLKLHGVRLHPVDVDVLLEQLRKLGAIDRLSDLLATFLNHYKANSLEPESLRRRADGLPDTGRLLAFIDVFLAVFERYQRDLAKDRLVDFHDFIATATRLVRSGRAQLPFRHVLVDEFQDISAGRALLLRAILDATSAELFAVGDDWQSIYQFAGSDISILRGCAQHFGYTERRLLTRTFRFDDKLLAASSRFVTANPAQIARELTSSRVSRLPAVSVVMASDAPAAIAETLKRIATVDPGASVLVLGRYRNSRQQVPAQRSSDLQVSFSTVHSAKGMEADYVVILDLKDTRFGFPSQVASDPILELVLPENEPFPHAEERRLFYVAMTRARKSAYVIADSAQPSAFVRELRDGAYPVEWIGEGLWDASACPECVTGKLRRSQSGKTFVCANAPLCRFFASPCLKCNVGVLLPGQTAVPCSNERCGHTERLCPRCRRGQIVRRTSQYGDFGACSAFVADPPCFFTEQAPTPLRTEAPEYETPDDLDLEDYRP